MHFSGNKGVSWNRGAKQRVNFQLPTSRVSGLYIFLGLDHFRGNQFRLWPLRKRIAWFPLKPLGYASAFRGRPHASVPLASGPAWHWQNPSGGRPLAAPWSARLRGVVRSSLWALLCVTMCHALLCSLVLCWCLWFVLFVVRWLGEYLLLCDDCCFVVV